MAAQSIMPVPPVTPSMQPADVKAPLSLEVVDLTEEQMRLFTTCAIETFMNYEMDPVFFPNGWGAERVEFQTAQNVESFHKKGMHYIGIFSPDKTTLISTALWRLEDEDTYDEPPPPPEKRNIPGSNEEFGELFFGKITEARKEIMGRRKYWHLQVLVTRPEYHRKGAGRLLVKWGTDRADADGLDSYLDASKIGRGLYRQLGFEFRRDNTIDLRPYASARPTDDFTEVHSMVRPPRKTA